MLQSKDRTDFMTRIMLTRHFMAVAVSEDNVTLKISFGSNQSGESVQLIIF